jgi:hypothetical protein
MKKFFPIIAAALFAAAQAQAQPWVPVQPIGQSNLEQLQQQNLQRLGQDLLDNNRRLSQQLPTVPTAQPSPCRSTTRCPWSHEKAAPEATTEQPPVASSQPDVPPIVPSDAADGDSHTWAYVALAFIIAIFVGRSFRKRN